MPRSSPRSPAAASGQPHVETPVAYDGILLAGFGGPEGQDDVIPFLRNVTRGRGIPDERLEEVAHHYRHFGGVSPINAQNRALKAAIEAELAARGIDLPVYWGNRNWAPYLEEAVQDAAADGRTTLLAIATSAYSSYSSCRQYREDFARVLDGDRPRRHGHDRQGAPVLRPPRVRPRVHRGRDRGGARADRRRRRAASGIRVLFSTHSIPTSDAQRSGPRDRDFGAGGAYAAQHEAVAGVVMASDRRGGARGRRDRVGARLPVPLRPADAAVARTRRLRRDRRAACARRRGGRHRAARIRERPHGSAVGPRHRGDGCRAGRRDPRRAHADARHRSRVRQRSRRPRRGAPRRHAGAGAAAPHPARPLVRRVPTGAAARTSVPGSSPPSPGSRHDRPLQAGCADPGRNPRERARGGADLRDRGADRRVRARDDHDRGRPLDRAARIAWAAPACSSRHCATRCCAGEVRPHRALVQGPPDRAGRRHPSRGGADPRGRSRRPRAPATA